MKTPDTAAAIVRRFFEPLAGSDLAGLAQYLDPDVILFGTLGGMDGRRVVRGPDAFLDYIREVTEEGWEQFEVEVERMIEAGDTVVVFMRESARARHGDLAVERQTAAIFKVREGKVVEVRGYLDRAEALEAAGLSE